MAEWSNSEVSTRLHMQLAGGNVCSEHKDISLLDGCRLFGSISQQRTPSFCDVASTDVDTLAALPVLLCALGNDKTMLLPISSGQSSHLATYPEIKLQYPTFAGSNFNNRIYCIAHSLSVWPLVSCLNPNLS